MHTYVVTGVSIILARLPHEEITRAMKELCCFQASSLWTLLTNKIPIERGTKTDPVIWLDRLAAIFKHTNPQIDDSKPHPCQTVITEVSVAKNSSRRWHSFAFVVFTRVCVSRCGQYCQTCARCINEM